MYRSAVPLDVGLGLGEADAGNGVVSPLVLLTLPRSVLSMAQMLRIPDRTAGRSGVSSTSVWFVFVKLFHNSSQSEPTPMAGFFVCRLTNPHTEGTLKCKRTFSAVCPKITKLDLGNSPLWNVSVHAHLMTSMKAPGLNMTCVRDNTSKALSWAPLYHTDRLTILKFARTGAACAQLLMLP